MAPHLQGVFEFASGVVDGLLELIDIGVLGSGDYNGDVVGLDTSEQLAVSEVQLCLEDAQREHPLCLPALPLRNDKMK